MDALKAVNLGVRFVLELCALAALAYWGRRAGDRTLVKVVLAVGAPLAAAIVWGLFVAPKATFDPGAGVRLVLEVLVIGCAVVGLAAAGRIRLGLALGAVYVVNRILMGVWGQ
jgi:hypothetical protein